MKGRTVTFLIVPDFEGTPHTFKLSILLLRIGLGIAILGIICFIVMAFTWLGLLRKAQLADDLVIENEQYRVEHIRVSDLEHRVRYLQEFEQKIRRALGIDLSNDNNLSNLPSSGLKTTDEIRSPISDQPPHQGEMPFSVKSTDNASSYFTAKIGFEIPSLWPVDGFISRGYEWNQIVPDRSHSGVDIAGKEGEVVKATAAGIVVWSGWSARFGNIVVLAHESGYFSVYGHNQIVLVNTRQRVERGMPIALLGNTGHSSAPHLHFEIWLKNQPIDPFDLLSAS